MQGGRAAVGRRSGRVKRPRRRWSGSRRSAGRRSARDGLYLKSTARFDRNKDDCPARRLLVHSRTVQHGWCGAIWRSVAWRGAAGGAREGLMEHRSPVCGHLVQVSVITGIVRRYRSSVGPRSDEVLTGKWAAPRFPSPRIVSSGDEFPRRGDSQSSQISETPSSLYCRVHRGDSSTSLPPWAVQPT